LDPSVPIGGILRKLSQTEKANVFWCGTNSIWFYALKNFNFKHVSENFTSMVNKTWQTWYVV